MLQLIETREAMTAAVRGARAAGRRVGLVATMGALHEGHLSLLDAASSSCDLVVLSVFVNPTQFDDERDFAAYPRALEMDLALAEGAGASWCFAPSASELYARVPPEVTVDPGPIGTILEGAHRPGHLRGVATVVTKLLSIVEPESAFFGEKDYQQLVLVRRLVEDLSLPVEIVGCPTVREPDGLARSSRNARLSEAARAQARVLYRALVAGRQAGRHRAGVEAIEAAMAAELASEQRCLVDYATARRSIDLQPAGCEENPTALRLLVAARFGDVRLIDNMGAA